MQTILALAAVLTVIGMAVFGLLRHQDRDAGHERTAPPAPVEVAPISTGPIELRRTFSGTLEPRAQFVVAPKVSGLVEQLHVRLADPVRRGQVVARLDNDEYVQAVNQAVADLAVAKANLIEAESALERAEREFERIRTLHQRGVASDSQLDASMAERSAAKAGVEVTRAQVIRAEAALETANIRLGYTTIQADWTGGADSRVVAERYVDEGQTVSANAELLLIVELDPITGVFFVSEKDYARLRPGQETSLNTDTYPQEQFQGRIERISPVFRQATRQARVELTIDNPELRLKPGMFIRATVILDRVEQAVIVPEQALTLRDQQNSVFVVNEESMTVSWHPVRVGIRDKGRVAVSGMDLHGRVVVLGQHLLDDGSPIIIPADNQEKPSPGEG